MPGIVERRRRAEEMGSSSIDGVAVNRTIKIKIQSFMNEL